MALQVLKGGAHAQSDSPLAYPYPLPLGAEGQYLGKLAVYIDQLHQAPKLGRDSGLAPKRGLGVTLALHLNVAWA